MRSKNNRYLIDKNTGEAFQLSNQTESKLNAAYLGLDYLPKKPLIETPREAGAFYKTFGMLTHDKTGAVIEDLTDYQKEWWNYHGWALCIKSQKIGLSTSTLLEDFQYTTLPEGQGKDVLIIAQTMKAAQEHVLDIKRWVSSSRNYRNYLISSETEMDEILFEEEKTKALVIYIYNYKNPRHPSRIIALGGSIPSIWSWKRVGRIHMSDVAELDMIEEKQDEFFSTAFSRLAITGGICKIETPPAGQQGYIYRLHERLMMLEEGKQPDLNEDEKFFRFKLFKYPVQRGIDSHVIDRNYLAAQKEILTPMQYASKYLCQFTSAGNQWITEDMIKKENWITT